MHKLIRRKQFKQLLQLIALVKPRYIGILLIVLLLIGGLTARQNNVHMVALRSAVYAADKDNKDVSGALNRLQSYVIGHMNTSLTSGDNPVYPPIQLKYTYQRLVAAEKARVDTANTQIYTDAQGFCETQNATDFSGRNRVPCIQQYIQDHGSRARTIPSSLYQFDFVSARWSPDLAGISLLLAGSTALLLVLRLTLVRWLVRTRGGKIPVFGKS